ncbi:MAG: 16S rRNA (cytosine(1402)-N(4))-methyltransferase RsmH [Myxococcales bacterium]|nr:16S rRNA (cytosine(1402)-N(4))-methyltransferase RsmH [Myxococcales bacterium]
MLEEVLDLLSLKPGGRILDATLGLGGHAVEIARRLGPNGVVIGLDRDPELLKRARERLLPAGEARRAGAEFRLFHSRFSRLREVVAAAGETQIDGVLLDLGVCSVHLDEAERGFGFRTASEDVPLDMRFERTCSEESAAELLARVDEPELVAILRAGEVPAPRRVAREIRARLPLRSTRELEAASRAAGLPRRRHHPATLVFQALRIAVNQEFEELERALDAALDVLGPGGRLVVLSYHSGEDRRVKNFVRREQRGCICPPRLPVCGCGRSPRMRALGRLRRPSEDEVRANPRARSARLRAGERQE